MVAENIFLLDTQVFIWWMEKNRRLAEELYNLINNSDNQIFLSVATVWEIVIKKSKGKLKVPNDIKGGIKTSGFNLLPIEISHVLALEKLPPHHRDPFDRILIAQAQIENCTLVTNDPKIKRYKIKTVG